MASNVIQLPPRPRQDTAEPEPLAFYVRVGRNDHAELLELMASGERGICGLVIEAQNLTRHRELMAETTRQGFHLVLNPKTQPMALVGGHSPTLAALPWGLDRHHRPIDFEGDEGKSRAAQIVEMAVDNKFGQILGPTHLLTGPNDTWLRHDIDMMVWTAEQIKASTAEIDLIYPLGVALDVLRNRAERQALVAALADAPCDAIWLKIENFGDDASGDKTTAYIDACRDFHERGVPVVGDHVGGLPGLGALAFGAVGGIAHGVTMLQNFSASGWRRPRTPSQGGGPVRRVYLPSLDILLKPEVAQALLTSSQRVRARCGCRDTHCCPHGVSDMISRPARHALYQRAREIEMLSGTPQSIRAAHYLDERVRRVSDDVASIAGLSSLTPELRDRFRKKQGGVARFRQAMAHLAQLSTPETVAVVPARRRTGG